MHKMNFVFLVFVYFLIASSGQQTVTSQRIEPGWPAVTKESKPWTRWWWMGSNVDTADLGKAIEKYAAAGLGGLEITPIYGVRGQEEKFIKFTSPQWMDRLVYTLDKAEKVDMGIDMALASGWPFGGPWVKPDDACKLLLLKTYTLKEGETINETISYQQEPILRIIGKNVALENLKDPVVSNDSLQHYAFDQVRFPRMLPLITMMGYSDNGEITELTNKVDKRGKLNWTATKGNWKIIAAFAGWHGKMVERAGPGGEGDVIDHFSKNAVDNYLRHIDTCFNNRNISALRAFFNDSYEVDDAFGEANWTSGFFEFFKEYRGYDLKQHLPALLPDNESIDKEYKMRIVCDYRETISELLLTNFTKEWQKWALSKGKVIRNQSHGSPANILDLYAASDIPETEGTNLLNIKAASSVAHVTGKKLVSAEAATWLNEHFLGTLAQSKENVDRYFVGGINHIVYHGTCFSPENEPWPGRMFYASVHYAPTNTIWKDFPTLNSYITRVQSFLQRGTVDNDILLYYPIHDEWMKPGKESILHFNGLVEGSAVQLLAKSLLEGGYSFDYISDSQLNNLKIKDTLLISGKMEYQTILVPEVEYMPLSTLQKLIDLAKNGATIIFQNNTPVKATGWNHPDKNQNEFDKIKKSIQFTDNARGFKIAKLGKGKVFIGSQVAKIFNETYVKRESLVDAGLKFIRLNDGQTKSYFISNWSENGFDDWLTLESDFSNAVIYNPMTGEFGKAKIRKGDKNEILFQLKKGESCIVQLWPENIDIEDYKYYSTTGEPLVLNTGWSIQFVEGGPTIPSSANNINVGSWTDLSDTSSKYFSGTAQYTVNFELNGDKADYYKLDLGEIHESASIILNGKSLGTVIGPDYSIVFTSDILLNNNKLEVEVSNLMANRIIYMDKNNIPYRKFYNTNFNAAFRENLGKDGKFTAKNWLPQKSGLCGPVKLIPLIIHK